MTKQERINTRNEQIVRKFYELYDVKRMRMDDVLTELETKHFFLAKEYIYAIVFYKKKWNDFYLSLNPEANKPITHFR